MPFPTDPNAPRAYEPHREFRPVPDPNAASVLRMREAARQADLAAYVDVELAIAEAIEHFADVEWPAAEDQARGILEDWLRDA